MSRHDSMRAGAMIAVLAAALSVGLAVQVPSGQATPPTVRRLGGAVLDVFACAPDRAHYFIASEEDLAKTLASLAPHCPGGVFASRREAFLRSLEAAGPDWSQEVLVIAQDWYGTGMAKPSLVFSGPANGSLVATIRWSVPPPPLTPDTASCTFAFAVRRAAVERITITGTNSGSRTFSPGKRAP